jgi:hypothetical protein
VTLARIFFRAALLAVGLCAATACEESRYDHVDLFRLQGDGGAQIGSGGLVVPEGGVLVFEAHPRAEATSAEYVGLERFKLRPSDPDVAMARRAILRDTWVVSGVSVGTTQLQVLVDNDVVDSIPVEIIEEEDGGQ